MMGPRCDFVCLSKKCRQADGAAPTMELPVRAVCCPACGSRRIQRIWTAPHVSKGIAKHVDAVTEPAYMQLHGARPDVHESGHAMVLPVRQLAPVAGIGIGAGKAAPVPREMTRADVNVASTVRVLPGPRPDQHSLVDRTSKVPT